MVRAKAKRQSCPDSVPACTGTVLRHGIIVHQPYMFIRLKNPSRPKNEESTSTICTPTVAEIDEEGAFRERVPKFGKILSLRQCATLVLTYIFLRVEIGDGILGSDTNEVFAKYTTVDEGVGFHSEILDIKKFELYRLEDRYVGWVIHM
jgi:hypothetical protein